MTDPTFIYETKLWTQGNKIVVGVDEVGRGPLAGPVITAAVVFPQTHCLIDGVNDSKKVIPQKRISLAKMIKEQALYWAVGQSSVEVINQKGINSATMYAMNQALSKLPEYDHALIDGRRFTNFVGQPPPNCTYITKGDQKSYSIAAASIIAKVYRDNLMTQLHQQHPHYGWNKNMGYGTKQHRQAIISHGLTPYHRLQFVRKYV